MSYSVAVSVFLRGVGGREGVVDDFCQARKAENTDPRTNYAVKYATARGRLNRAYSYFICERPQTPWSHAERSHFKVFVFLKVFALQANKAQQKNMFY